MRPVFFFLCLLTIAFLFLTVLVSNINNDKQKEKLALWLTSQKLLVKLQQTGQLTNPEKSTPAVLGSKSQEIQNPQGYMINLSPRKQIFNLSCEFAVASSIIHHFTDNDFFASSNGLNAEKTLMEQIGVSQNPNIGIRMGVFDDSDSLYKNLNQKFGGADYYGVHAPPFIELFEKYNLMARPINKNNTIEELKKAIFSGHLVMAWIKIGYGESVDVALSYGPTKVVKGEHVIIIHGYNQKGVTVMDPGSGTHRFLAYETLLLAAEPFPMPFLEVYPSIFKISYMPTERVDIITGLDRSVIKIEVKNGGKVIGAANNMGQILHDFGYKVISIGKADNQDYEGVTVKMKNGILDYKELIKKDITLAGYKISSFSADLHKDLPNDVSVIVGFE